MKKPAGGGQVVMESIFLALIAKPLLLAAMLVIAGVVSAVVFRLTPNGKLKTTLFRVRQDGDPLLMLIALVFFVAFIFVVAG
jgi:hypothetical protein